MRVFVIGPSGSGKSTHARRLAKMLSVKYIYVGAELRKLAKEPSDLGRRLKSILDAGEFVKDKKDIDEVFRKILVHDDFVVDGTPRTLYQMKLIDRNYSPTHVIYIKVEDGIVIRRLLKRERYDDNQAVIKNRLKSFYNDGNKIIDHYKKLGVLHEVDGSKTKEGVWQDIKSVFKSSVTSA